MYKKKKKNDQKRSTEHDLERGGGCGGYTIHFRHLVVKEHILTCCRKCEIWGEHYLVQLQKSITAMKHNLHTVQMMSEKEHLRYVFATVLLLSHLLKDNSQQSLANTEVKLCYLRSSWNISFNLYTGVRLVGTSMHLRTSKRYADQNPKTFLSETTIPKCFGQETTIGWRKSNKENTITSTQAYENTRHEPVWSESKARLQAEYHCRTLHRTRTLLCANRGWIADLKTFPL